MPGLVGFTKKQRHQNSIWALDDMLAYINHTPFYRQSKHFEDERICSASSLLLTHENKQPGFSSGIYTWLDGEIYATSANNYALAKGSGSWIKYISDTYQRTGEFSFLNDVDGTYSFVLYDSKKEVLHLGTDHIGLKQLFYCFHEGYLSWASEAKAFLGLPGFSADIDESSIPDFIKLGHLLGNKSWFKHVLLVPPGSVVTCDLNKKLLSIKKYTDWTAIQPDGSLKKQEATERLAHLFSQAVRRRMVTNEKIIISLSGGLDSRAILAASLPLKPDLETFTFGQKGIDDVEIATNISKEKGLAHQYYEIHNQNWLPPRIAGIWWTDGQTSLLHMHGVEFLSAIKEQDAAELNGFLGDAILGEGYLRNKSGVNATILNRGRRLIYLGIKLAEVYHNVRTPFIDIDLFRYSRSLPRRFLNNHNIYSCLLLDLYGEYFKNHPWSNTRMPLSSSSQLNGIYLLRQKIKRRLTRLHFLEGLTTHKPAGLGNYQNWLRKKPARLFITNLLFDKNAIYPEFIDPKDVRSCYDNHMKGLNLDEKLCRYITFEIWLQQIYNQRFRSRPTL